MTLVNHTPTSTESYRGSAGDHLWRHFADMSLARRRPLRVITRGEGCYLIDSEGNRLLDGLSNLFCVNVGYSYGAEFAEAAAEQYRQLGYHSSWGSTHPRAIELAAKIASLAPVGLNHVFLTPSGGESVEAAWKVARQYYRLRGERRWKAISREMAYHGTTMGALSLMGIPELREPFAPLVPTGGNVRNTKRYGRPAGETEAEFTAFLLADLEQRIVAEGSDTVAMVIIEPVQNHGGMLVAPAGYHAGVRALCDRYGILLVADETITAFGRVGAWFAAERYGMRPDIITTAKGLSSAHAVLGAIIVSDDVFAPFDRAGEVLLHGNTFGGHPVMAAVALRNLEIMQRLDLPGRVRDKQGELRSRLESLSDLDVVVDVRGTGFFFAVELASKRSDGTPLTDAEKAVLYGDELLAGALEERGVLLRISLDGGDPVVCVAPPLVADTAEFDVLTGALRDVLTIISQHHGAL